MILKPERDAPKLLWLEPHLSAGLAQAVKRLCEIEAHRTQERAEFRESPRLLLLTGLAPRGFSRKLVVQALHEGLGAGPRAGPGSVTAFSRDLGP